MSDLRARDEQGSALVIALVFVVIFGIIASALLTFMDTAFRTTGAVRTNRAASYAVDGATNIALNSVRTGNPDVGAESGPACGPFSSTVNGRDVSVTCQPQPGSGKKTLYNGAGNMPRHAILTTATVASGEDGIDQNSNSDLAVKGSVYSNSTIVAGAAQATLSVDGAIYAEGDCDTGGKITSSAPPLHCANSGSPVTDTSIGDTPNWPSPLTGVPAVKTVPSCPANRFVELQPGTYDPAALTALTGGSCAGVVVLLDPGDYYLHSAADSVWTINDANAVIVGGTPKGWNPGTTRPTPNGACDLTKPGMSITVGGGARIAVAAGALELCPTATNSAQQFSIYGVPSTIVGGNGTVSGVVPASATSTSSPAFAPVANARVIDAQTATVTLAKNTQATLDVSFPVVTIPAGATVSAVRLRLAHQENANVNAVSMTVTGTWLSSSQSPAVTKRASLTTDTFTLPVGSGLTGLTATSVVLTDDGPKGNGPAGVADVDGMALEVDWVIPGLAGLSGCTVRTPYPPTWNGHGAVCPLLHTDGAQTQLYLHGTVFAPTAPIDITLTNQSGQALARGLVARAARLKITPASTYDGPLISLPDTTPGGTADRQVLFTAWLCAVSTSNCPTTGSARLRAMVTFIDGNGDTPGAEVKVSQWSVLR